MSRNIAALPPPARPCRILVQRGAQALEVALPDAVAEPEPGGDGPEGRRVEGIDAMPPFRPDVDQADPAQDLEMRRYRRLADVEIAADVGHRARPGPQGHEDVPPRRVGDGSKHVVRWCA